MAVCKTEKPLQRSTPPSAVLFDLGNTLAAYYRRDEFQPILERALDNVRGAAHARYRDGRSRFRAGFGRCRGAKE
jgi:hypothetical protein